MLAILGLRNRRWNSIRVSSVLCLSLLILCKVDTNWGLVLYLGLSNLLLILRGIIERVYLGFLAEISCWLTLRNRRGNQLFLLFVGLIINRRSLNCLLLYLLDLVLLLILLKRRRLLVRRDFLFWFLNNRIRGNTHFRFFSYCS